MYGLIDPRDGLVWYVGRSVRPAVRFNGHLSAARSGKKSRCATWVRSLLRSGRQPLLVLLEECPSQEHAVEAEAAAIALARSKNKSLTNSPRAGTAGRMCKVEVDSTPIYVRTTELLRKQLDDRAAVERRTLAAVVMVAIEQYLAKAPVAR